MNKKTCRVNDEMGEIKKGPWKVEEDEVLISHVKKYGPRDWSSIRSKGLLLRTGKSCRLRWVNKLRPNLKNGVKFSEEEGRIVIDLQAQFGNKWARIATYLPGRTDNDVKNFWSSRQKKLARTLQTPASSSSSSSSKSHRISKSDHAIPSIPVIKVSNLSSWNEKKTYLDSQSRSSFIDHSQTLKMVTLPDIMKTDNVHYEQSCLQPDPMQSDFTPSLQNQDLFTERYQDTETLGTDLEWIPQKHDYELLDSNYLDVYGQADLLELGNFQLPPLICLESERYSEVMVKKELCPVIENLMDDLPIDLFDHIDPLPSPSNW